MYKLPKDVLQHVLAIALGRVEAMCDAENVTSLANKVLQIVFIAWQRFREKKKIETVSMREPTKERTACTFSCWPSAGLTFVRELV